MKNQSVAPLSRRSGLTLIECLVVLLLVGLMAALLIPAVFAARESARKSMCAMNMRQVCLGLNNYLSTAGCFPRGWGARSFHVSVLPFVEQTPLLEAIEKSGIRPDLIVSQTVADSTPSLFLCPSDAPGQPRSGLGWTSYAGNRGSGYQAYGFNGIFVGPPGRAISSADVADGSSNTAMIAEWVLGSQDHSVPHGIRSVYHTPGKLPNPNDLDLFASACSMLDLKTARIAPPVKGRNWLRGELGNTLYNHVIGPNGNSCLNGSGVQTGAFTASSTHPSGVNVGFVDGHVQSVSRSVGRPVWRALGSRAGGEFSDQKY